MNRIALYHIETLIWIARLGTFSAAAERMNTSQPSVSTRVRELEHILGVALFQREGRRMLLTAKGRQFVQEFETLWFQIESTLLPSATNNNLSGIIKVGCGEIAAIRCLPKFLADISRQMPNLCMEVEVDLTINLRHKLQSGLIDIAIIVGPIENLGLIGKSIGKINMRWFVNRALFDEKPQATSRDMMMRWPIWCLSRPSHLYELMTDTLRRSRRKLPMINTCNNVRTLIEIILKGGGTAILPEALVKDHVKAGDLVKLNNPDFDPSIEFFTAIRRSEADPVVLEVFKRARHISMA